MQNPQYLFMAKNKTKALYAFVYHLKYKNVFKDENLSDTRLMGSGFGPNKTLLGLSLSQKMRPSPTSKIHLKILLPYN